MEASEPIEPGEKLGSGESLGGGVADVPELSVLVVLGVVSDGADDGGGDPVGLVEVADGRETGDNDGTPTLDGPSVDDVGGVEPELG